MLLQVLVEYSETPSGPLSLGRLIGSTTGRWVAIGLGGLVVLYLLRRGRMSTFFAIALIAAAVYYGRSWIGW